MAGNGKSRRGFASMDPSRQREIASRGGRAAHAKGTAHEWSSDEARVAGRKGGEVVSRDRAHMAAIGREGGEARGANARAARAARFGDAPGERTSPAESSSRSPIMDRELSLNVSREGMADRAARTGGAGSGGRSNADVNLGGASEPRGTDELRP
jgi:general stress protein YciG